MKMHLFCSTPKNPEWKIFRFEFKDFFLEIAREGVESPFTALHLGMIEIRLCTTKMDKPDVIEVWGTHRLSRILYAYIFTYETYDLIDFVEKCKEMKAEWERESINIQPQTLSATIKPRTLMSMNQIWKLNGNMIEIEKFQNVRYHYSNITIFYPIIDPSHKNTFIYQSKSMPEMVEYKTHSFEDFKKFIFELSLHTMKQI